MNPVSVALYHHGDCLLHDPPPRKGLAPLRLSVVVEALRQMPDVVWREGRVAERAELLRLHMPAYVDRVLAPIAAGQTKAFDFETIAVSGTARAALRAVGLVLAAVEDVGAGEGGKAFCLASPGGHHAEAELALGFCFFAHVALAADLALARGWARRVAVLDFDAHHGNGTQSFFWNHANRLFVSLHEETGLSGFAHETGAWDNVMNIPLARGADGGTLRRAMGEQALPKIRAFAPDILFVSAGFDGHREDPLSGLAYQAEDYAWLGEQCAALARDVCGGRVVAVMEGGYNPPILATCAAEFIKGLSRA